MSRSSSLSVDNILRFLQVRDDGATFSELQRGLRLRKSEQHALNKILSNLKKRKAIVALTDGQFVLASRSDGQRGRSDQAPERSRERASDQRSQASVGRNSLSGRLILHQDGYEIGRASCRKEGRSRWSPDEYE